MPSDTEGEAQPEKTAAEGGAGAAADNVLDLDAPPAPKPPPAPAPAPAPQPAERRASSAAQAAQFEATRRREMSFLANRAIEDGNKLLAAGEVDQAIARYEYALNNLQSTGDTAPSYQRAAYGLSAAYVTKAQAELKEGDVPEAVALYEKAKSYNPTNPKVLEQLTIVRVKLKEYEEAGLRVDSKINNPAWNEEFKERVATVQSLFYEGERLFETGQYDKAEQRYLRILALDPYNKAARQKLERLERAKYRAASALRKATRAEAMYEVTDNWSQKVPFDFGVKKEQVTTQGSRPSNLARMNQKLQEIVIPRLVFNQLDVEQAVRFLADKSRELDPEGVGVNFVLKLERTTAGGALGRTAPPAEGEAAPPADVPATIQRSVTLELNNVPLIEAIRFLSSVTNLQAKIEEFAVYLIPTDDAPDVLTTRTYSVPAGFFSTALEAETPPAGSTATTNVRDVQLDVKKELIDKGVSFDAPGSTAAYLRGSSKLVVKNTPDQLDLIQALVDAYDQEVPQVEIQTKFAEFTDDALRALTVNWYLSASTDIRPILNSLFPISVPANSVLVPGNPVTASMNPQIVSATGRSALRTAETVPNSSIAGPGGLLANSLDAVLRQNVVGTQNPDLLPQNFLLGSPLGPNQFNQFAIGGVIGRNGFGAVVNMIDNLKGVDLLSAPKVTAKNRTLAKIEVVRELRYPSEFERPTINPQTFAIDVVDVLQYNSVIIALPATPREFEVRNIGVTLEVTPTTYPDQRIDLDLTPEIVDFEGFVNYGQPIVQRTSSTTPPPNEPGTTIIQGVVNQPVFNVRTMSTKLQVLDGQTITMGGLIREDRQEIHDKIPFLGDLPVVGRAFRSKVEQSFKRNLIIFVTARLIKSDGSPLYGAYTEIEEPSYEVYPLTPMAQGGYYEEEKNFGGKPE